MVHTKYTYKDGKRYGPYLYANKRVNGQVVTEYVGSVAEGRTRFLLILGGLLFVALLAGVLVLLYGFSPTGRVIADLRPTYAVGEPLSGRLLLTLEAGEVLPADAQLRLTMGGQQETLPLEAFGLSEGITGPYFIQGASLTGDGAGYGLRASSQPITFQLEIGSSSPAEPVDSSEASPSQESVVAEASSSSEAPSSVPAESVSSENASSDTDSSASLVTSDSVLTEEEGSSRNSVSESASVEEPSSSSSVSNEPVSLLPPASVISDEGSSASGPSDIPSVPAASSPDDALSGGESILTGAVIGEPSVSSRVNGEVYSETATSFAVSDGASVSVVPGSVRRGEEVLADNALVLERTSEGVLVRVSPAFEQRDTLDTTTLSLDLSLFDLPVTDRTALIEVLVADEVVLRVVADVEVPELPIGTVTVLKDIPTLRMPAEGFLLLNLSEYFEGATSYLFDATTLEAVFEGEVVRITPAFGFTGAARATFTAVREGQIVTSNVFTVLVGRNVNITTSRAKIVVGAPVHWTKEITVTADETNVSVHLPAEAERIAIVQEVVSDEVLPVNSPSETIPLTEQGASAVQVGYRSPFTSFTETLGSITGLVVGDIVPASDAETAVEVVLPEPLVATPDEMVVYTLTYETPAPTATELVTPEGTEIVVSGPESVHYTDVLASTTFSLEQEGIPFELFWKDTTPTTFEALTDPSQLSDEAVVDDSIRTTENIASSLDAFTLRPVPYDLYDLDGNGKEEYLEWVVPHLSNQTYTLVFTSGNSSIDSTGNVTFEGAGTPYSHLTLNQGRGILAYYPFEPNTTLFYDYGNNSFDADKNGDALVNTTNCMSYGSCLHLDGTGDYLTGDPLPWDPTTQDFSFSVWASLDADASPTTGLGLVSNRGGATTGGWMTFGYTYTTGRIGFELAATEFETTFNPAGQGWQHYVAVKNASGLGLYINKTYVHVTNTPGNLGDGSFTWYIGDWYNGAQNWKGNVDEVMFFNRSLNQSDVNMLYNNQTTLFRQPGTLEIGFFNISSGSNRFNLTLQNYLRPAGSNISARLGEWDIAKGYNTSDFGLNTKLLAYYNFDNNTGIGENQSLIVDRKGNFNGTIIGAPKPNSTGMFGGTVTFYGAAGSRINISTAPNLDAEKNATFTGWFKNKGTGEAYIIVKHTCGSTNGFFFTTTQGCYFSGTAFVGASSLSGLADGKWHHFACTKQLDNYAEYIDGVLFEEDTGGAATTNARPIELGAGNYGTCSDSGLLNGELDEVMLFNRSLTANEVSELYVKGRALWTYGAYQNLTSTNAADNQSTTSFILLSNTTTNVLPSFMLLSDANRFFTPVLQATSAQPGRLVHEFPFVQINFPANTSYTSSNLPLLFNVSAFALDYSGDVTNVSNVGTAEGTFTYGAEGALGNSALYDNNIATSGADPVGLSAQTFTSYDFGANNAKEIRRVTWANDPVNGVTNAPTWKLSYSDNKVAWTQVGNAFTTAAGFSTTPQVFDFPASGKHRYWNISYVSGTTGGNVWVAEVEMLEHFDIATVRYTLDNGITNYTMTADSSGKEFNASNASLGTGSYTFKVYANDSHSNTNYTTNVTFSFSANALTLTSCSGGGCLFVRNVTGSNKAIFDRVGTVDLAGTVTQSSVGSPNGKDLIVQNGSGSVVAWLDDATGNLRLAGTLSQNNNAFCTAPAKAFTVKNATGGCVAYIDSSGNFWTRLGVNEAQSL